MSEATRNGPGTALAAPSDNEIQRIREAGRAEIAYRKELVALAKQVDGLEWGKSLSKGTQYAVAQFCRITRANPISHIDLLGGKPYLNANYWQDRINSDPLFIEYQQREISETTERQLRAQAAERRETAEAMKAHDANRAAAEISKALDLEQEADEIARARRKYRVPEWAVVAYETVIRRFINAAPIEAIRAGEIPGNELGRWITEVRECNWAGGRTDGKKDPVGNQEPEKTARTRSLRRAAAKAFPAWMQRYDEQIQKAEYAIEAEWEDVQEARAEERALLAGGEQAASTGAGEPERAASADAEDLPGTVQATPREEPSGNGRGESEDRFGEPDPESRDAARRAYFASLRDAGITGEKDRKAWQQKYLKSFPESTTEWTASQFHKAVDLLLQPWREKYLDGCRAMQVDPEDYALNALKRLPETVGEYRELVERLNAEADAAFAKEGR